MQRRRVHGQRAEEHVVGLGDGPLHGVLEPLADLELLEVQSWHKGPS